MDFNTVKTVSFFGTCTANSTIVLVSQRISTPFELATIAANFALNTNRKLQLEFYISPDPDAPSAAKPNGFNILSEYGQVFYLTGDDQEKTLKNNASKKEVPSWLKVYANNIYNFDHTIDVQITINILPRE